MLHNCKYYFREAMEHYNLGEAEEIKQIVGSKQCRRKTIKLTTTL